MTGRNGNRAHNAPKASVAPAARPRPARLVVAPELLARRPVDRSRLRIVAGNEAPTRSMFFKTQICPMMTAQTPVTTGAIPRTPYRYPYHHSGAYPQTPSIFRA